MKFETVIGLEIHAQLKTESKIFCGCSTKFGAPPNSHTCPVCLGLPGSLPVLNKKVVEFAIKMGLATGSDINRINQFARKNYFYPDLPKGYQTSQFDLPIVEHGEVEIEVDGKKRVIGITRMHMEEDAGKLIHDDREPVSYVDLNRTGTPLLEIVSEPDIRSPEEAAAYLRKIHAILRYLDICDGNMQEGSFRCDANISLRPVGQEKLGTRTELKNMNSFRNVQSALEYEVRRQRDILMEGGTIVQETLLWNPDRNCTESMRSKDDAHDYRYFPCPDLVPVRIDDAWIEEIRATLPELPEARKLRFIQEYELPEHDASLLTNSRELADYFETAAKACNQPKKVSNWMMTELMRELKGEELSTCKVGAEQLGSLVNMVETGTISGKIAKTVFLEMMASGKGPETVVEEQNLGQVSNESELLTIVRRIIADNPGQVTDFKGGKTKLMSYFVGQLMQKTKGQANPALANKLFTQELAG
ncbi:MAG: Asp-tRNA(Asn)/Glu-tRNA(Gln) amidotransferase subunit GatB [Proteobacteria bacterium]|nr:Asp-tRNA(Asn)/Glu-tRNA(Gln) amidotransferase subunit GatB [Desulfocapsa sp.]MBU3946125.1 Asp-tRNA(Asn)/Glu-tRNA(Gln) amidotransferase subunit GatB [Pseudomonadota bacterium]MCG2742360.1 Asp-tRNA(Asn)/Glu-tRNA(Gln) amidotransferase subunit GatB [Desulfobacteraceae bacterium]MBU4027328.1 Asp-tRNA(Asn)/Glu-tRNA(Gln) amidotransferase subunit GatB [Pseudomonadota bacterium]MBU4043095.1 Asp-tRNA(Asn)/Glu-tRNA(Gln) amidotransferase subunit GatB [Pseudomonadota bacterium]